MSHIQVLDSATVDKIAAGEVVERPCSVAKELLENSIDSNATAITLEIKNGGIDYLRVTDNGSGIERNQVKCAFLRHATSKIKCIEDLLSVTSLGFRGEALSSISAVARVELLTKVKTEIAGTRYVIEGAREMAFEDTGVPNGTTIIVRDLFYNVPARRKFLKTGTTEASYISELMEHMILSHPEISFKYIVNGNVKLQSVGDSNLQHIIYSLYGKSVASLMQPIEYESENLIIRGFIGKPELTRSNHNYEIYFVNRRSVKSSVINKALDEAYKQFLMQHKFPYAILYFSIPSELLDVNVHPTKMEIKFMQEEYLYNTVVKLIRDTLSHKELIPEVSETPGESVKREKAVYEPETIVPEPFEIKRSEIFYKKSEQCENKEIMPDIPVSVPVQETFLSEVSRPKHVFIGQIFDTYLLVQFEDKLYMIDQHAAHEKIRYERLLKYYHLGNMNSQLLNPPLIMTLTISEQDALSKYMDKFVNAGFEIEHFGGNEYAIYSVPTELYGLKESDYFKELLDTLSSEKVNADMESILARIASTSCKGAVKAGKKLSYIEANALIDELLKIENPFNCPHGRPVIIAYSKSELEKKFKRII